MKLIPAASSAARTACAVLIGIASLDVLHAHLRKPRDGRLKRLLKQHNADRLRQIERQKKAMDDAIMAQIAEDASLKARFHILVSIPGVSQITAFTLLIKMPELGDLDEKAAAALSGLAPMSRQSGGTGCAVIAGGRAVVRQALDMPALARRFSSGLKIKYDQLKAAGSAKGRHHSHHATHHPRKRVAAEKEIL